MGSPRLRIQPIRALMSAPLKRRIAASRNKSSTGGRFCRPPVSGQPPGRRGGMFIVGILGGNLVNKYLLMATVAFSASVVCQAYAQDKTVFALVPKSMNNPFYDQALAGCKKAESE